MAVDALALCIAKTSSVKVLNMYDKQIFAYYLERSQLYMSILSESRNDRK